MWVQVVYLAGVLTRLEEESRECFIEVPALGDRVSAQQGPPRVVHSGVGRLGYFYMGLNLGNKLPPTSWLYHLHPHGFRDSPVPAKERTRCAFEVGC